ncbi:MAG TPA: 50S ribosomal protein L29 [Mycobacteriales bacterium]
MATVSDGAEFRELGDEELVSRLRESKEELFNLRFQSATGQLENNRRLRVVRHDIARVYTVMRERELGITYAAAAQSGTTAATTGEKA